ncbi:MAG: DNA-directed RNA polymerase subunit H [Candidatus Thermoplasmatota archaeon]|jgi:DNA-directed RNA polymerase subunit H (RpoH/RPB5)|nr:DNA-directed RNA polymerase subunit H [Candidatus Thermoplasmatota archaeon]MCL5963383.1 DNA-directed RNA polymerase subunit H [Candidatus Thermoplasmatota archaeon]
MKKSSNSKKKVNKKKIGKNEKTDNNFNYIKNELVPVHTLMDVEEELQLLKKYNTEREKLPKIFIDDPALYFLKESTEYLNRIVKIERNSRTAGHHIFYRVIVERSK